MASETTTALPEGVTDPNYKPLPGRLGNLTAEQQDTLTKFKKALQDEGVFVPRDMMTLFCSGMHSTRDRLPQSIESGHHEFMIYEYMLTFSST